MICSVDGGWWIFMISGGKELKFCFMKNNHEIAARMKHGHCCKMVKLGENKGTEQGEVISKKRGLQTVRCGKTLLSACVRLLKM